MSQVFLHQLIGVTRRIARRVAVVRWDRVVPPPRADRPSALHRT